MDLSLASILTLDGVTSGAVYALLALATVLIFAVTRVVFIALGEFVAYSALTLAALQAGKVPGTVWVLLVLAILAATLDVMRGLRRKAGAPAIAVASIKLLTVPLLLMGATLALAPLRASLLVQSLLSLALVTALGPLIYRVAYEKVADASVLVLMIVSVGVHFVLTGIALASFGAEGFRNPSFWGATFDLGPLSLSGQSIIIFLTSIALMLGLALFFEKSLRGKALKATAVNRFGARLMAISTEGAGRLSFGMAAFIGGLCGLLIAPTTTIFYDSGFLIGLKGFVAAIFGGLASYPAAALGALLVGILESFGAFWASPFKEVIVFTLIIPVLLWRSLREGPQDDEE